MKNMLHAVNHHRPVKTGHMDNAFYAQQILTTKLHEHGHAGLEQACVYRFVEHQATRLHAAMPIFIMGGVCVNRAVVSD